MREQQQQQQEHLPGPPPPPDLANVPAPEAPPIEEKADNIKEQQPAPAVLPRTPLDRAMEAAAAMNHRWCPSLSG
jgi:hypothetical protein